MSSLTTKVLIEIGDEIKITRTEVRVDDPDARLTRLEAGAGARRRAARWVARGEWTTRRHKPSLDLVAFVVRHHEGGAR